MHYEFCYKQPSIRFNEATTKKYYYVLIPRITFSSLSGAIALPYYKAPVFQRLYVVVLLLSLTWILLHSTILTRPHANYNEIKHSRFWLLFCAQTLSRCHKWADEPLLWNDTKTIWAQENTSWRSPHLALPSLQFQHLHDVTIIIFWEFGPFLEQGFPKLHASHPGSNQKIGTFAVPPSALKGFCNPMLMGWYHYKPIFYWASGVYNFRGLVLFDSRVQMITCSSAQKISYLYKPARQSWRKLHVRAFANEHTHQSAL